MYSVDGPIQMFLLPKKNVPERRDVMKDSGWIVLA
jgi:hypothetical protein